MKKKHPYGLKEIMQEIIDYQADSILIQEGLIFSYAPEFIFRHLKHSLNIKQSQIKLYKGVNQSKYFEIEIKKEDLSNLDKLMNFMQNISGWISAFIFSDYKDEKFSELFFNEVKIKLENDELSGFIIQFDAKFDVQVSQNELPEFIFHVTLKDNINKILKIGLKPTSGSKISNHPDRIYFTLSLEDAKQILKVFYTKAEKQPEDYRILKIDVSRLPENILFFEDPRFLAFDHIGVYTLSNIHPTYIKLIEQ